MANTTQKSLWIVTYAPILISLGALIFSFWSYYDSNLKRVFEVNVISVGNEGVAYHSSSNKYFKIPIVLQNSGNQWVALLQFDIILTSVEKATFDNYKRYKKEPLGLITNQEQLGSLVLKSGESRIEYIGHEFSPGATSLLNEYVIVVLEVRYVDEYGMIKSARATIGRLTISMNELAMSSMEFPETTIRLFE